MSKKIKVPYEYSSQFFGNTKRFRWFEVSVPDHVTYRTFVPDFVEHSATITQLLLAEKACAKLWLTSWFKNPQKITKQQLAGLLTVLDTGIPGLAEAAKVDVETLRTAWKYGSDLEDVESAIIATYVFDKLEQENG